MSPEQFSYIAATQRFASGASSPRAYLETCIERINAREKQILAFVALDIEAARRHADAASARWAAGKPLSSIDGMPVGVKDVIETRDMPTANGSALFTGVHTGRDSASIKALRQAGGIILGKTVTTEFAASVPGPTRHPQDPSRTPGGSSSGSAAGAAAGFFPVGLGTQVVGSILRPAGFCGVRGFKPSLGGVNRGGSHDFMSQSVQGALGVSLADIWHVLIEIVARTGGDPGFPGLAGPLTLPRAVKPRALAVLETPGWAKVSDGLKASFEALLARLARAGALLLRRGATPEVERVEQAIEPALALTRHINGWESIWPLNIYRERDASKLSKEILARLEESEKMSADDYRVALSDRASMRRTYETLSTICDGCITLTAPGPAPVGLGYTGDPAFVVAGSALGAPAITLPLLSEDGLPVGVQLLGFEQRDAAAVGVARWIEATLTA